MCMCMCVGMGGVYISPMDRHTREEREHVYGFLPSGS